MFSFVGFVFLKQKKRVTFSETQKHYSRILVKARAVCGVSVHLITYLPISRGWRLLLGSRCPGPTLGGR